MGEGDIMRFHFGSKKIPLKLISPPPPGMRCKEVTGLVFVSVFVFNSLVLLVN